MVMPSQLFRLRLAKAEHVEISKFASEDRLLKLIVFNPVQPVTFTAAQAVVVVAIAVFKSGDFPERQFNESAIIKVEVLKVGNILPREFGQTCLAVKIQLR